MKKKDFKPDKYRILAIDDAEPNLVLLRHVLESEGFQFESCRSGEEALSKLDDINPDLILLDINMPGMNGFEVSKSIQNSPHANIPIIFLSGANEIESMVGAFDSGGVDFINKPFAKEEVLARIKTHLLIAEMEKERMARIQLLQEREQQLSLLNAQKNELIRMVSHDIKNPLTGIIGMTNMMLNEEDIEPEEFREMLELVDKSAQKLFQLVKDLLDKESKELEETSLNIQTVDLAQLLEEVLSDCESQAYEKNISLNLIINTDDYLIEGDADKLRNAFSILVMNSIAYTYEDGHISITINPTDEDQCQVEFQDTGIGISESLLNQFIISTEPDKDPDPANFIGEDLGLDIVRKTIELHDGKIWVNSTESVGTTFFVQLPLKKK